MVLPLPWGSWPACKEGQEGSIWAKRPFDALCLPSCCAHLECVSPPAEHTWSTHPQLLCTLGVCISCFCAHLKCASPAVHTWSVYPLLLCTLGVCTPDSECIGVCIPSCCAHLECVPLKLCALKCASPPAVHTWCVHPLLLCTLRVCSSLFFQGNPSHSSRCGRVVSVLKETPTIPGALTIRWTSSCLREH